MSLGHFSPGLLSAVRGEVLGRAWASVQDLCMEAQWLIQKLAAKCHLQVLTGQLLARGGIVLRWLLWSSVVTDLRASSRDSKSESLEEAKMTNSNKQQ